MFLDVITNWSFALFLLVELTIFGCSIYLVLMIWHAVIDCFNRSDLDKADLLTHLLGKVILKGDMKNVRGRGIGVGLGITIMILVIAAIAMYVVGHFSVILSKHVN